MNFVIVSKENNQQLYLGRDAEGNVMTTGDIVSVKLFETEEEAAAECPDGFFVSRTPTSVVALSSEIAASRVKFAADPNALLAGLVQQMMLQIEATLATAHPHIKYDPASWRINITALRPPKKDNNGPRLIKP